MILETPKLKCFAGLRPEVFVQTLPLKKERLSLALVSASQDLNSDTSFFKAKRDGCPLSPVCIGTLYVKKVVLNMAE